VGASKIVRDITERKRIEETIYENQLMLTLAMQSSKMGVWELDLATNTVSWSEELEQIFGFPKGGFGGTEEHFYELITRTTENSAGIRFGGRSRQIVSTRSSSDFIMPMEAYVGWKGRGQAVYSQTGQPVRLYGIGLDITDRKESDKALRESERRFSRFMQHLPGLAWIKDTKGRYVYANEAAERAFGVSGDALYGKTDEEIFPAETAKQFRTHDRHAIESGTGIQIVESMVEGDGVLHHSVVSKFPIAGADGKPALIGGMAIDITEQKQAEESVRNSEEKYRTLFDSMDEGYCIIEVIFDENDRPVDYLFVEVNSAFERQAGMHDVTGKRMLEFVSEIETHWLETYGRVAKTGEPIRFANEYKGLHRWFDVYAFSPTNAARNHVAVLFTDITSRVKAEESLRESSEFNQDVIDSIAAHIAVLDDTGEITAVNEAWRQFAVENGADWTMRRHRCGHELSTCLQ
jgi:PAS domain S-box-containing protein